MVEKENIKFSGLYRVRKLTVEELYRQLKKQKHACKIIKELSSLLHVM